LLHKKTERLTESLTDASQLSGLGRSRIAPGSWAAVTDSGVRCGRGPRCLGFSSARLYKLLPGYHRTHPKNQSRVLPSLAACAASVVYSIPSIGVHRRTGEQVSGTTRFCDPVRERVNWVFGKCSARLLKFFITGHLPSKSGGAAYRRHHCRLLRLVFSNVVINTVTAATTSASEQYV
jgi:hypothetical protein